MTDISREPSDYSHTTHSRQQSKHRGIDNPLICEAIKDGQIEAAARDHQRKFVLEVAYNDEPVGVIVDADTNDIITVEWVKD